MFNRGYLLAAQLTPTARVADYVPGAVVSSRAVVVSSLEKTSPRPIVPTPAIAPVRVVWH